MDRKFQDELHSIADCGSVGLPWHMFSHCRLRINGTHSSDIWAHDNSNSVRRALVQSGSWLLILEWSLVSNYSRGPFLSHSCFENLVSAGADCCAFIRAQNFEDDNWCAHYPDIAKALNMWDRMAAWSLEHMSLV